MIGLVDCNNFFVSCERVFRPELLGRPVIVLSNNDGCAVALSNEAKALGFKRGDPYFKIKNTIETTGAFVFSGNHRLYGDMSSRVMATLGAMADNLEIYSIDEAFLSVPDDIGDYCGYGHLLVQRVRRDTGIPVSLGIASTKTLAKIASRFAKKYPAYRGVCIIDTDEKAEKAMSLTAIEDVWGIGRRHSRRLRSMGINTALDLARTDRDVIESIFSVTGVRTWLELQGTPSIPYEFATPDKKTITSSRSFAHDIHDRKLLEQAVSSFATIAARKLRQQSCSADEVSVFIATNRFHDCAPQYFNCASCHIPDPTSDTTIIIKAALQALGRIYRPEYGYKKAGLTLTHIVPTDMVPPTLFDNREDIDRRRRLMDALDRINSSPSAHDSVRIAATGQGFADLSRREHASRLFTTRLSDIITVRTD